MKRYVAIDLQDIRGAGLSHQFCNLRCLLSYCYHHNYTLIVPQFNLWGFHNNSKELNCNLSKYIDYESITIDATPVKVLCSSENVDTNEILNITDTGTEVILWERPFFKETIRERISFSHSQAVTEIAKRYVAILGKFLSIHVRRTDRNTSPQIDRDTSPENLLKKIREHNIQNVYIMTDESTDYFKSLKDCEYSVWFYSDFDELIKIKADDNYFLFSIEREIAKFAVIRISTLKHRGFHITGVFDDFLSETS